MYYVLLTFGQRCFQGTKEECEQFIAKMVLAKCDPKRFVIVSETEWKEIIDERLD